MLMHEVPGSRFLDLFAGTGAVGIEALSRGAESATWVERDKAVARLAAENVAAIAGADAATSVVCGDAEAWVRHSGRGAAFTIVFADPPYADARGDGLAGLAEALASGGAVAEGGLLVSELPVDAPVVPFDGWTVLRDRRYGKTRLVIRQRNAAGADGAAPAVAAPGSNE